MTEVRCPSCGYETADEAKFCRMCEKRMPRKRRGGQKNRDVTKVVSIVVISALIVGNFLIFITASMFWGLVLPFVTIILSGIVKGALDERKARLLREELGEEYDGEEERRSWRRLTAAQRKVLYHAKKEKVITAMITIIATLLGIFVIIWAVGTAWWGN